MLRILSVFIFFVFAFWSLKISAQVCTVTGASPLSWVNPGPSCSEGGTAAGKTILIIPAGVTVVFNSNGDTWSGTRIDVYGTLHINFDVTINSSITVYNGGLLKLDSKLSMGTSGGCGYGLSIKTGGTVDVGDTGSDRLSICGTQLMKGNGACNSCSGTNSGTCTYNGDPYCEPSTGFTGPLGYDEDGYDVVLPIKLVSMEAYQLNETIQLEWATASEENFDKFIVQRSTNGQDFDSIGFVGGAGMSKQLLRYSFIDQYPTLGKNYYRLKSLDHDLTFDYSPLVAADFKGTMNVIIYPNPSSGAFINVRANFHPQEGDRIEIYDNLGLKLLESNVSGNLTVLQLDGIVKQGSYLLRYISEKHSQVIRLSAK